MGEARSDAHVYFVNIPDLLSLLFTSCVVFPYLCGSNGQLVKKITSSKYYCPYSIGRIFFSFLSFRRLFIYYKLFVGGFIVPCLLRNKLLRSAGGVEVELVL